MASTETHPNPSPERAAVSAQAWCWPAFVAGAALVLDAFLPLRRGHALGVLWLDLAAIACLLWTLLGPRRAKLSDWATPVDGRVVSGFVLAILHVVRLHGAPEPVLWLRQITAAGVCFYALGARMRRDPDAPDSVWPAFALLTLVLSAWVFGRAVQGMSALAETCREVDLNWVSRFGLAKTLMLLTLLCCGRASEPGAPAWWRVSALAGAVACALCLVRDGAGLGVASLASLDEPFYFGTSIVAFMFLASLSRMAWLQSRERVEHAGRWRGATLMFPLIAGLLLFGGTTGGEGVRAITALAGAAVIAARLAPRAAVIRPAAPRVAEPPLAQAA
jgi:hypothetical protein